MENNHLDRIIKGKLERIDIPYDPSSWENLAEKLDLEEVGVPAVEDNLIDQTVYEKLHQYSTPYDASTWKQMSRRLDEEFSIWYKIIRYKVVEISVLLLALFVFFQQIDQLQQAGMAPIPEASTTIDGVHHAKANGTSPAHLQQANDSGDSTPPGNESDTNAAQASANNNSIFNTSPVYKKEEEQKDNKGTKPLVVHQLQPLAHWATPIPQLSTPGDLASLNLNRAPAEVINSSVFGSPESLSKLDEIGSILPGMIDYAGALGLARINKKEKNRSHLRVGFFATADYNYISAPSVSSGTIEVPELVTWSTGYGGGISLGWEFNRKFEVETGLVYSAKRYQPQPVIYTIGSLDNGYSGGGITEIEMNTLYLPIYGRYNFFLKNKWRMYVIGGMALNVVYQANYYLGDETAFDRNFLPPTSPGSTPESPPKEILSQVDERDLDAGWFENGTFNDNAYITANLGFGIERYFSHRFSIFAQPVYQQSMLYFDDGLGANKDRINNLSILIGLKANIW